MYSGVILYDYWKMFSTTTAQQLCYPISKYPYPTNLLPVRFQCVSSQRHGSNGLLELFWHFYQFQFSEISMVSVESQARTTWKKICKDGNFPASCLWNFFSGTVGSSSIHDYVRNAKGWHRSFETEL